MQRVFLIAIISAILFVSTSVFAKDLSESFSALYKNETAFSLAEQKRLQEFDIYLVPGILSESFILEDKRSPIDFAWLTRGYFSVQVKFLKSYRLNVRRLDSSSRSVEEIRTNIRKALWSSQAAHRQALFITHSLGGLALLEELVRREDLQKNVGRIVFLQSPFAGTPVADLYAANPYYIGQLLKPALPFFNTTEETIEYMGVQSRRRFLQENEEAIRKLVAKIPMLTVGGVANAHSSIFKPAIDIMAFGCVKGAFGVCLTKKLFQGPYDQSDGMVPFESSKLQTVDYVQLVGVDHGETVVHIPFETLNKERMTLALLKLLL